MNQAGPAELEPDPQADPVLAEEVLGLDPQVVRAVAEALDSAAPDDVSALISPLHAAEIADLLEQLDPDHRGALVERLKPAFDPVILTELNDNVREEVVGRLGTAAIARGISRLESDDALYLITGLDEARQREVVFALPAAFRDLLEEHLSYPEESAGRLMQRDVAAVPAFWTVGETIDYMREAKDLPNDFYVLYVVDPRHRPVGTVPLNRLLRAKRPVPIESLMDTEFATVPATMDQEEVAYIFRQQDLVSGPVVDEAGRLIGTIMIDDVVDVIHEETAEDLMRLGGVREDDLFAAVLYTGRARFSWLFVNLVTAALASSVIGLFEDVIGQIVMLAVLMPIVASMGGNAGTQTLTVVVRAIATKDLTAANMGRVFTKEILVGLFNGALFAALMGVMAWLWSGDPFVGGVMASATILTLLAAGLAGALIPVGLTRAGIDPAIASSVLLTTVTDVVGFAAFLGLAAWILL